MKKTNVKNVNKGITLIALVITIIIMLILATVTIRIAFNGGLIDYAKKATGEMQNAIDKEQEMLDGRIEEDGVWYNSIEDYIAGIPSWSQGETKPDNPDPEDPDNDTLPIYADAKKDANGILEENAIFTEGTKTATVPKGFKVINGLEGTQSIEAGLVIQDKNGNEFVWIPVAVTDSDTETSIASFYRSEWSNNARAEGLDTAQYIEPYEQGYPEEVADYNKMLKSVYENKGFYIGRYEAGTTEKVRTNISNGTSYKSDGKTIDLVVKRDVYPYTYVGWGSSVTNYTDEITYEDKNQGLGALELSKGFYKESDNVGVESLLCYGIQWDAMLDFIKDEKNVTNSTTWGNYKDNVWTLDRPTAKWTDDLSYYATWKFVSEEAPQKTSSNSFLLTTGANDNFAAKNIFDVAGNVFEITNEVYYSDKRVLRGCGYWYEGFYFSASFRWNSTVTAHSMCDLGFRLTLCVK